MSNTRQKRPEFSAPSRESLQGLLFAAYNIGPGVEPGDSRGQNLTRAAIKTVEKIYDLMDGKKPGTIQGVLLAVRLIAETTCAQDPESYALHETQRGETNEGRHEDEGATIKLPRNVKTSRRSKA